MRYAVMEAQTHVGKFFTPSQLRSFKENKGTQISQLLHLLYSNVPSFFVTKRKKEEKKRPRL